MYAFESWIVQTWIPYNLQGGFVKDGAFLLPNGGRRTGSGSKIIREWFSGKLKTLVDWNIEDCIHDREVLHI
jgi:hypothetical protein